MRIVVVGGGFGGLEVVRGLQTALDARPDVELVLVSDRNYLLFTPLLPQVASSLVEPRHIVQPIRDIRGRHRWRFRRDQVLDIDLAGRRVIMAEGTLTYDRLVIALGAVTQTFGTPGVAEYALDYKWLGHAIVLRDHLIDLCEHADHEPDPARRRRMLTIAVVGGGYTGVELVAELQDFFSSYVVPRYRGIDPGDYRLLVIEGSEQILRGVHPTLAERARKKLDREGIEVLVRTRVTRVRPGALDVDGGREIHATLTIWAGGVKAHPLVASLPLDKNRLGRLMVNGSMQVPTHPEVYGVGDAVVVDGNEAASVPIVPAALAHGRLVAQNLLAEIEGRRLATLEFSPRGMLVSLGEHDAVVDVGGLKFSGYGAWLFWNAVHLWKLVGFRKQIQVAIDWSLARHFPRDSTIMRAPERCPLCHGADVESERAA